jgi:hypothetical protein
MQAELEGGTSLPKTFPDDVSIYPGAEIAASGKMAEYVTVTLKTQDRVIQVLEFYRKELRRRGWKLQPEKFSSGTVEARKAGRECIVAVDPDPSGEGAIIGVTVMP